MFLLPCAGIQTARPTTESPRSACVRYRYRALVRRVMPPAKLERHTNTRSAARRPEQPRAVPPPPLWVSVSLGFYLLVFFFWCRKDVGTQSCRVNSDLFFIKCTTTMHSSPADYRRPSSEGYPRTSTADKVTMHASVFRRCCGEQLLASSSVPYISNHKSDLPHL